jgi:hypothetical protein
MGLGRHRRPGHPVTHVQGSRAISGQPLGLRAGLRRLVPRQATFARVKDLALMAKRFGRPSAQYRYEYYDPAFLVTPGIGGGASTSAAPAPPGLAVRLPAKPGVKL